MILTGVLRHYATILLATTPKPLSLPALREQRSLLRGINLRSNSSAISPSSFTSRKNYLVSAYKDGTFLKDPDARGKPAANPMTDPAAMEGMMGMMKGNMAMMIPQTLIMGWINAFFAGFVISVFPLPFRVGVGRGIGLVCVDYAGFIVLIRWVVDSETAVPIDDTVQVYATIWRRYTRSRCAMGV
jgi:hypothetical protein